MGVQRGRPALLPHPDSLLPLRISLSLKGSRRGFRGAARTTQTRHQSPVHPTVTEDCACPPALPPELHTDRKRLRISAVNRDALYESLGQWDVSVAALAFWPKGKSRSGGCDGSMRMNRTIQAVEFEELRMRPMTRLPAT